MELNIVFFSNTEMKNGIRFGMLSSTCGKVKKAEAKIFFIFSPRHCDSVAAPVNQDYSTVYMSNPCNKNIAPTIHSHHNRAGV